MRLEGKVAIVTGGARGQGEAEARLFAREGAKVVIGDVLDDEGGKVAAEITEAGSNAIFVHLDVTSEEDWRRAIETTVSRFGKLDVLVNNAAIWRGETTEETSVELWDKIMDVNAKGPFLGTKLAIPEMRKAEGGSIINICSNGALVGANGAAAYCASKAAVRQFTRATAVQYGKESIRANSIYPGPIDTAMFALDRSDPERRAAGIAKTLVGRIGLPEDVAYGALYLASDESSMVTGIELVIDGGVTAQ